MRFQSDAQRKAVMASLNNNATYGQKNIPRYGIPFSNTGYGNRMLQSHKLPSIDVFDKYFSFKIDDDGKIKLSLGNLTDSGWYWNGDETSLVDWFYRMVRNNKNLLEKFANEFTRKGGTFQELKPIMVKSVKENDDGFYTLTGDNNTWRHGTFDFGDGDVIEQVRELVDDGKIQKTDYEEFLDTVWDHYDLPTYEEFANKHKEWLQTHITKAINDADSFDELKTNLNAVRDEVQEMQMTEVGELASDAVRKAMNRWKSDK